LGPLTSTLAESEETLTPFGSAIGILPIRDIATSKMTNIKAQISNEFQNSNVKEF
jgi:hypothetical protein